MIEVAKYPEQYQRVIIQKPSLLSELIASKGWHESKPIYFRNTQLWKTNKDATNKDDFSDYITNIIGFYWHPDASGYGHCHHRDDDELRMVKNDQHTAWLAANAGGRFVILQFYRDASWWNSILFEDETDKLMFDLAFQ